MLIVLKGVDVGMHLNIYNLIWFKLGTMIDITELYILMLVLNDLTLVQGHKDARNPKLVHQKFQSSPSMEFGVLLKIVCFMKLVLILSDPLNI